MSTWETSHTHTHTHTHTLTKQGPCGCSVFCWWVFKNGLVMHYIYNRTCLLSLCRSLVYVCLAAFSSFSDSCLSFVPHPFLLLVLLHLLFLFLRRESTSFLINSFHRMWRVRVQEVYICVYMLRHLFVVCYQFSPPESTGCFFLFHFVRSALHVGLFVCQLW